MLRSIAQTAIAGALCTAGVGPAMAGDLHVEPVRAYVEANVRPWIEDPVIIESLKAQNARHVRLTSSDINGLDAAWRMELSSNAQPLIHSVLGSALSNFLKERQASSDGVITEVLAIDAKGLNAGESEISSDYWQGDEPKWQKTYLAGAGVLFVDKAEKDESTQLPQSQASLTVSDPQTGQPIGTITVGINLDAL